MQVLDNDTSSLPYSIQIMGKNSYKGGRDISFPNIEVDAGANELEYKQVLVLWYFCFIQISFLIQNMIIIDIIPRSSLNDQYFLQDLMRVGEEYWSKLDELPNLQLLNGKSEQKRQGI